MKKIFLLATAALLISGVSFAGDDKGKDKKKKATKSSCSKSGKSCGKTTPTAKI
jgi:hypothetical protein